MVLERLTFSNPGGWWAMGAVAAVVALYLFYRRYRPLPITGLFLWGEPRRDGGGGSRLEKPIADRSFWLDVAAAALLALALAGPGWRGESRIRVVILDNSIAMQSRRSHEAAAARVASLWSADVATAVLFAGRETSVAREPALAGGREIAAWLTAAYRPAETAADLEKAALLARELYGDNIELHIFSNRDRPDLALGGVDATVHVLAGAGGNITFRHVWRRDAGGGEEVLAEIGNYNDAPVRVAMALLPTDGKGTPIFEENATLPAGTSERRIPVVGARGKTLTLSLTAAEERYDSIAVDSVAYLPPQPGGLPTYDVDGLDETSVRYAALALEAAGCPKADENATPELLVTDDPDARGGLATLFILPAEQPGYLTPPYLVDFSRRQVRDVDLSQSAWVAASRDHAANPDEVYISAGRLPLYWREGTRFFLNLYPARASLPRDPAWPVLMANLARHCRTLRPGLAQTAYPPGAAARYVRPAGQSARSLRLLDARDGAVVAAATAARAPALPHLAGLYRLEADGEAAGEVSVLPLYGPAADTRTLAPAARTYRAGGDGTADDGVADLRWLAVLLACAALGYNYLRLSRRGAAGGDA